MKGKYKFISLTLVFAIIFSIISVATSSFQATEGTEQNSSACIIGDADLDGKITVKDATKVQKHVAKILKLNEKEEKSADFLPKPGINIKCATFIQKYAAKINLANTEGAKVGQNFYDTESTNPVPSTEVATNPIISTMPTEPSKDDDDVEITLEDVLLKLNAGKNKNELAEIPHEEDLETYELETDEDSAPEHFYQENMAEDEIFKVIDRISSGENVIFGDGIDYNQRDTLLQSGSGVISSGWSGGLNGKNKTHQWLVTRAFKILSNDNPVIKNRFTTNQIAVITEFSDWPDVKETNEMNNWHFYYYHTKTNFQGNSKPTAKSKFIDWYNSAVNKYNRSHNDVKLQTEAFQDLGKCIHYLSDLGTPVHTGDRAHTFWNGGIIADGLQAAKHVSWEFVADQVKKFHEVESSEYYSWYTSNTLSYITEVNACISYDFYSDTQNPLNVGLYYGSMKSCLKYTQKDVAGLLYKFYIDTNELQYN